VGCNGQGLFGTPTFVRYSAKHLKVVSELLNCEMSLFVRVGGREFDSPSCLVFSVIINTTRSSSPLAWCTHTSIKLRRHRTISDGDATVEIFGSSETTEDGLLL